MKDDITEKENQALLITKPESMNGITLHSPKLPENHTNMKEDLQNNKPVSPTDKMNEKSGGNLVIDTNVSNDTIKKDETERMEIDDVKNDDDKSSLTNNTNLLDVKSESSIKNEEVLGEEEKDMDEKSNPPQVNGEVDTDDMNEEDKDNTDSDESSQPEDEMTKNERLNGQREQIKLLKEQLVTEEITLCLYRKIMESQRNKGGYKNNSRHQMIQNSHMKQPQVIPKTQPPHKPPSQPVKSHASSQQQPAKKYYIQVGNQLVPAPPPSNSSSMYQYTNGVNTPSQSSSSYQPPKQIAPVKQTPEQKQNAAKAVLRRQLEQTLLQIPPPRPPPADWKVIPNVNSMDFMMLVGLDEVVDCILDNDKKPTLKGALEDLMPYNPRICAQCQVDFSPCWKNKEGNAKDYVVCERCASHNIKKDLKAEHTARLKSAFLKALKQEQEIEEKIKAGEDVNIGNLGGANEKENQEIPSPKPRLSSPLTVNNHSPVERHNSQHGSSSHHRQHQVVQHYPQHTSLVQQLHHQHIQQQQMEMDPPSSSRHSSRWHPYKSSSASSQTNSHQSHREHSSSHHRSYVATPESGSPMQEYYVVHHPQHASVRYISR